MATPPAGAYKADAPLAFTLTISEAVTVTGTPRLSLTIGTETRYATYVSGSGTTSLVFTYTVQLGDTDAGGIAVASTSVGLNGGTLSDAGGWPITLALPEYTLPMISVDTTAPMLTAVTLVSSKHDGDAGEGRRHGDAELQCKRNDPSSGGVAGGQAHHGELRQWHEHMDGDVHGRRCGCGRPSGLLDHV
jgi:hypothetical protein